MDLDMIENVKKPIFPKPREDLLDFLLKQRDSGGSIAICPRCNAVFDHTIAKTYEKGK